MRAVVYIIDFHCHFALNGRELDGRTLGPPAAILLASVPSLPPGPAGLSSLPTMIRQSEIALDSCLKRQRMFLWDPCGARVRQKKGEGKGGILVSALLASASPHAYPYSWCRWWFYFQQPCCPKKVRSPPSLPLLAWSADTATNTKSLAGHYYIT